MEVLAVFPGFTKTAMTENEHGDCDVTVNNLKINTPLMVSRSDPCHHRKVIPGPLREG